MFDWTRYGWLSAAIICLTYDLLTEHTMKRQQQHRSRTPDMVQSQYELTAILKIDLPVGNSQLRMSVYPAI